MQDMVTSNSEQVESAVGLHYVQEAHQSFVHHFYITGEIGPAQHYIEMIHIIRSCSPGDVVYVHLNTTGGHLDSGIQIINAMRESAAHIICSIEAQAFSMGSMIFLCADDFIVHDNAMLMIHNFNSGMAGKGNEQRLRLEAVTTLFDQLVRPIYIPFLDEDEFEGVIDGKDIWLQTDQIKERLERMVEARQAEIEEAEKPEPKKRKPRTKKS